MPVVAKTSHSVHGSTRPRGLPTNTNYVPPTDGREHDRLERWKGVPILTWGVGGTIVTSFPKSIPRYGMNQATPSIIRTNGEVKVGNIKELELLQERLSTFPGPLKGKSKKKEVVGWLSAGIESLEKELPDISFHAELSLEVKRAVERLLLWKILRIHVEHDGILEGDTSVEKAVRDVLSPSTQNSIVNGADAQFETLNSQTAPVRADGVVSGAVEQIRDSLMKGERETAVWSAADKRLWGHAMLIANTVSADLYKQVAQEFIRKEVNYPGHNNESTAALYKIFSGNYDDCVDELVPVHARAGLQLMSTQGATSSAKSAIDGLDKWQETLTLVLSNRSPNDIRGLRALGNLLADYGRAEAAQICFIFSRQISVFGGIDDPNANIVLVGSDHRQQSDHFAKETEALQLSEVYEYGSSLAGGPMASTGAPHLAAYKLQHAITLAEYGHREKALQYCDAITVAMTSQTKRSPYHHTLLEGAVVDFMTRLKQAPKGETSSWMSKPSMNKVSDSMWNRFNKFVAGDENENGVKGAGTESENGPFARIAGTPNNLSRPPSVSNFDVYAQGGSPAYQANFAPPANASSKYAPVIAQPQANVNPYAPAPAAGVAGSMHAANPYEPTYSGAHVGGATNGVHTPLSAQHHTGETSYPYAAPTGYHPNSLLDSPDLQPSQGGAKLDDSPLSASRQPLSGYEAPQLNFAGLHGEGGQMGQGGNDGYQPPSFQPYGYEPPSYEPEMDAENGIETQNPKKKSFMDDDGDDIPTLKPQEKSKSEKDRENAEMFRKAAEEDGKC